VKGVGGGVKRLRLCLADQFPGTAKDLGHHGFGEPAGVGVLERRMVGAQQLDAVREFVELTMSENESRFGSEDAGSFQVVQVGVKGDFPQGDDDLDAMKQGNLAGDVR